MPSHSAEAGHRSPITFFEQWQFEGLLGDNFLEALRFAPARTLAHVAELLQAQFASFAHLEELLCTSRNAP
jgi:hypothetical protein